ncbi:MAG: hypothetical protein PVG18_10220 [Thioalkalispiraceae bacterium]|jgi:hypothetical protein
MEKLTLDILQATFFNVILAGTVIAMLYGLYLLVFPASAVKLNQRFSKGFSLRKTTRPLETPVSIERWFYRHARITGSLLMLGAAYLFFLLFWGLDYPQLTRNLPGLNVATWDWLLQAFQVFFTIMSLVVFLIGFLIVVRPSLLKPLEAKANTWVSTRQKMQFMSASVGQTDQLLARFPRQFGAIILIASAIVLINMDKFKF